MGRIVEVGTAAATDRSRRHAQGRSGYFDEIRTEFTHTGVRSVAEAAAITARHPGAWRLAG